MTHSIRIILVGTTHAGNIGSTARAMKTMGLSTLYLVAPKARLDQKAYELAAGADDILAGAVITHSLEDALAGCQLILATSARPRDINLPGLYPNQAAELIAQAPSDSTIAILFGREHAGLTNAELLHAHYHIFIPTNPNYSSLNLAQAVQVIAYEVRMKQLITTEVPVRVLPLAKAEEVELFFMHLESLLVEVEFLKPTNPKKLMQRLRKLFNRIKLEKQEVDILRGMLSQVKKALDSADQGKKEKILNKVSCKGVNPATMVRK